MLRNLVKVYDGKLGDDAKIDNILYVSNALPEWVYYQLCAEEKNANDEWENVRRVANEAWDLAVYCRAAALRLGVDRVDWNNAAVAERCAAMVRKFERIEPQERADAALPARDDEPMRRGVRGRVLL